MAPPAVATARGPSSGGAVRGATVVGGYTFGCQATGTMRNPAPSRAT